MTIEPYSPADARTRALATRVAGRVRRPIVLVGLMGVGKTSIGRRLSHILSLPFTDADEEIERAARMTVSEVFAQFGEAYFRDGERRVIARLMAQGHGVIATGGGAFVQPDTRALILESGIAIWLDSDIATLVDRVGRKDTRPLLRGGDPAEILRRLQAEREPAYAEAPIRVQSGAGPQAETVQRVLEALDTWL
ncbi:shikimate kinase [Croceibacterium sp. TMG7-5b_MA50]|uniref:shikimate kinase n=1 Tax=Croceibacterium sp. TMG7-5b_MA50 TaxID=3121290 RepID=UPI0032215044